LSRVRFTSQAREDLLDIWRYVATRDSATVADRRLAEYFPQAGGGDDRDRFDARSGKLVKSQIATESEPATRLSIKTEHQ
jgi:hypothetical protein